MTKVTGIGCSASAVIGVCVAVEKDRHVAASTGMAIISICGDMSANQFKRTDTFQVNLYDNLLNISDNDLKTRLNFYIYCDDRDYRKLISWMHIRRTRIRYV